MRVIDVQESVGKFKTLTAAKGITVLSRESVDFLHGVDWHAFSIKLIDKKHVTLVLPSHTRLRLDSAYTREGQIVAWFTITFCPLLRRQHRFARVSLQDDEWLVTGWERARF